MRRLLPILLSILLLPIGLPFAGALSCAFNEDAERLFRIHHLGENRTLAEVPIAHWGYGSVCGFGNTQALSGDWFAWLEPGANATEAIRGDPWTLHVLHLPTGNVETFTLPASDGHRLGASEGMVVFAYRPTEEAADADGFRYLLVDAPSGQMREVTGDLPPDGVFLVEGTLIHWLVVDGDQATLHTRDAKRDASASIQELDLPGGASGELLRAANDGWLVITYVRATATGNVTGVWAYDRTVGRLHDLPGVRDPFRQDRTVFYVEFGLDGDDLYLQDASGLAWLGRGDYHRIHLPDGAPERLERPEPGEPADGLSVDDGRMVLRTSRSPQDAAEPAEEESGAPEPGNGTNRTVEEGNALLAPGPALAVVLLVVSAAALRRRLQE